MTCCTVFFRKKASSPTKGKIDIAEEVSGVENTRQFSYKELRIATEDFNPSNKIGEGGFGTVYKGKLKDGTLAAIKVLSVESRQGFREFLTEIVVISGVEHENLVKLYGCCGENDQRILVYEYLENNSLSQTLLGGNCSGIQFSWKTRTKICIGIAQGLSFLHEEVRPHIIHRDIKASNILLDKDLTPKISDFGLAKLFPPDLTHISTRVAGTLGYLAPEYAIRGQLTRKVDIYSFGILLLEIVTGSCNRNRRLPADEQYLLERVWKHYKKGELAQLVDASLEGDLNISEACRYLKVGIMCTQVMPKQRPSMSSVVKMLGGEMDVDDEKISEPGFLSELMALKSQDSNTKRGGSSSSYEKQQNSSSPGTTMTTYATMTFGSIYDRSA